VDAFLEAHDSGLSEADKAIANGNVLSFSDAILRSDKNTDLLKAEPLK